MTVAPERLRAWIIFLSLSSLPFIVPHVVEDFAEGIAQRVGLSTGVGAFLLGGFLALQSLGLVLVGRGRRSGLVVTFWVGLVWVAGALLDHGPELMTGRFREGVRSVLWVVGLIVTQAASSILAGWGAWRRKS
jgi:hypothetical protein